LNFIDVHQLQETKYTLQKFEMVRVLQSAVNRNFRPKFHRNINQLMLSSLWPISSILSTKQP